MRKILFLFITLCLAHVSFAQLEVNNVGNTGIGAIPNAKAKLLLNSRYAATDTIFGLHSFVGNTTNNSNKPVYGAYFKSEQTSPAYASGTLYGIRLDNKNTAYGSESYGVYAKNDIGGFHGTVHGFYAENIKTGGTGTLYGFYANNTFSAGSTNAATLYGAYLNNAKQSGSSGDVYGIRSINTNNGTAGIVHGAHFSASSNANAAVYGVYSIVSGGNAASRYSGYFTGGKVVVMNGDVGINTTTPAYKLDVNGIIRATNVLPTSDDRLKSNIKPLFDEKDRLYLLEGKSYKKRLLPTGLEEDSLIQKTEEIIEFPEYGYLAQELKEIFPDLVSQDTDGYHSVNYIGLIPVIVEALKDQRLVNEKQQIQIERQQTQIEEQREQIKQLVKLMGIKSIDEKAFEENGIESIPLLLQNTPNPFNQATEIGYFIPANVNSANIYIYDMNGFQQRNISIAERGKGITVLQATALQAGIYFYTLICDGEPVDTKQMILTI